MKKTWIGGSWEGIFRPLDLVPDFGNIMPSSIGSAEPLRFHDEDEGEHPSRDVAQTSSSSYHTMSHQNDYHALPALQTSNEYDEQSYQPVNDDDPRSFDLLQSHEEQTSSYSLEKASQALFSKEHLKIIFADPTLLYRFTTFLGTHRPQSVPVLVHYLDSLKALRALHYANAICDGLDAIPGLDFTNKVVDRTANDALETRANATFDVLAQEVLPAYITHQYIQIVSASISARVTGALSSKLREASEGLAEVFCLTDPSKPDNPIVFASDEFNRTTQYGMSYAIGRNCRFLQGPVTNPNSVRRFKEAVEEQKPHQEVFLNYRRDGSPFMNLLMIAPLCDSRGTVRYHIGAQVDVSGLVKECSEMESLQHLLELQERGEEVPDSHRPSSEKADELRELSEMLNANELATVRRFGGKMHRDNVEEDVESVASAPAARLLIHDPETLTPSIPGGNGRLSGIYQHYLLVRPYPSLRILFASPSQRMPGILQSPLMNKIGGSSRVRDELTAALADGRGVTAKVRWVSKSDEEGRNKWIHCTPLMGVSGQIGVWMIVLVDDHKDHSRSTQRARHAPPIATPDRSRTPATMRNGIDEDVVSQWSGSVTSLRL